MTVKLLNKGQRDIHHEDGVLKAGGPGSVSKEIAEKLCRLFPGEVFSWEDLNKQFEAEMNKSAAYSEEENKNDSADTPLEKLNTKQLKAKAKELNINVPHGSTDADIVALIQAK